MTDNSQIQFLLKKVEELEARLEQAEELLNTVDSRSYESEQSIDSLPTELWDISDLERYVQDFIDAIDWEYEVGQTIDVEAVVSDAIDEHVAEDHQGDSSDD